MDWLDHMPHGIETSSNRINQMIFFEKNYVICQIYGCGANRKTNEKKNYPLSSHTHSQSLKIIQRMAFERFFYGNCVIVNFKWIWVIKTGQNHQNSNNKRGGK